MNINNPSASFTRPADTNVYAHGDLIANSVTAGSVVPMQFALGNTFGVGSFRLTRAWLTKSGTTNTNATFRIHLFQALPTVANGDNGVFSASQSANWLGSMDLSNSMAFTDGCTGFAASGGWKTLVTEALGAQAGLTLGLVSPIGSKDSSRLGICRKTSLCNLRDLRT
jgi:hypothetical protein